MPEWIALVCGTRGLQGAAYSPFCAIPAMNAPES